MKKLLLLTVGATFLVNTAFAQGTLKLSYSKSVEKNSSGSWEKWPAEWESEFDRNNFVPTFTLKNKVDDIYVMETYFGGSSSGILKYNVVFDPGQTSKVRKQLNTDKVNVYRFAGSNDYLWTENTTLDELYKTPSKWNTIPNARIYTWEHSLGTANMYTAKNTKPAAAAQPAQKFPVSFNSNREKVKGTWTDWSQWQTAPKNSYFELKVVTQGKMYDFKYYENGLLKKNYTITYNKDRTLEKRDEFKNYSSLGCYDIKGTQNGRVYLLNTTMGNMIKSPDKWSSGSNAVVMIYDDEKAGNNTRIK